MPRPCPGRILGALALLAALPALCGANAAAEVETQGPPARPSAEEKLWQELPAQLKEVLRQMESANKKVTAVRARIRYEQAIPLLDEKEEAPGTLIFKKPDLLIIKLGKPRREDIHCDGKFWWVTSHKDRQVEIYKAARSGQGNQEAAFLRFGYNQSVRELLKEYEIVLAGKSTRKAAQTTGANAKGEKAKKRTVTDYALKFTPRSEEAAARYSRIEISVADDHWLPHRIVLHESDGEVVQRFTLEDITVNPDLKDAQFRYRPPKRYTIVHL